MNHLKNETSPYLLQHVDNPVDWYPWGPEALQKAKDENKPILLSIGYSACHWCHVMAHESFEDQATADVMNDSYINIKVDREERPDIDKIYQTAQHLLTQRTGGWPLTMFLTPEDQLPFFGGTYFPDKPRHNLPAFKDLLQHIAQAHQNKHSEIVRQNQSLQDVMKNLYQSNEHPIGIDARLVHAAKDQLVQSFDRRHGGFGSAPKFPHPANIELLLRIWQQHAQPDGDSNNEKPQKLQEELKRLQEELKQQTLKPALYTLERMGAGGIFDHVGGGFCRYSVDDYWMIPHFEKMLYDNGALLTLYCYAYQISQDEDFKQTAQDTADWVMREMQSPEGGYYSSLDADSEGEEGKFYVWTQEQCQALLSEQEYAVLNQRFGFSRGPNFEDNYHLHEFESFAEVTRQLNMPEQQCRELWQSAKHKLFAERQQRIAPGRDEKILTSWNGLMIKGMIISSRVFNQPEHFQSAQRALEFIQQKMFDQGRLFATYKDNKAHLNAYLDDYAFLLDACLEYLQVQWNQEVLDFAVTLADVLLEQFSDPDHGGFFFTANDHENLIQRPKVSGDEATPSGNGIAAQSLLKLGLLLSRTDYIEAVENTLEYASQAMTNSPVAHGSLLACLQDMEQMPSIVIIRGSADNVNEWRQACQTNYQPQQCVFAIADDCKNLPEALAIKFAPQQNTAAYVCQGLSCQAPAQSLSALQQQLQKT